MNKRCSTPFPCRFDAHCKHRQTPLNHCNGFFWPDATGESCRHYELNSRPEPDDLVERLSRMAGAHE